MAYRILVVSAVPWNTNNNFGNSYSNIFNKIDVDIANIYLSNGFVNDKKVRKAFEIDEKKIIKSIFFRHLKTGVEKAVNTKIWKEGKDSLSNVKSIGKKFHLSILLLLRELIWLLGKWNTEELTTFIKDYNPNLLFAPINGSVYPNRIILKIAKKYNLPIIGYISDDNYTLKQFSLSPFFWIKRLLTRNEVGKVIRKCKYLYVISEKQKKMYDKIFRIDSKILTKGLDENLCTQSFEKNSVGKPLQIVYTGNIALNRWKTIGMLCSVIDKINKYDLRIRLDIYSGNELSSNMRRLFNRRGVEFKGAVPASSINDIQKKADILLHVEAMDFWHKWDALYGFSTKIVDYFGAGKAIFAIGNRNQASIEYLKDHDISFVATNYREVESVICDAIYNEKKINEYALKSYLFGRKYHSLVFFSNMITNDIRDSVDNHQLY